MLQPYVPILVLLGMVVAFAIGNLLLSELVGRPRRGVSKNVAYECGMSAQGDARLRLSIHFYLVAVLFIVFDVESLLLIPWVVAADAFSQAGVGGAVFLQVTAFLVVLAVGLAYEWRKGGLSWDR